MQTTPLLVRYGVLPLAECVTRTRFWSAARQMNAFDRTSLEQRRHVQSRRLAEALVGAAHAVPHWRAQLAALGLAPGDISASTAIDVLRRFPFLTKATVKSGFPHALTAEGDADDWRVQYSSGTTDRVTVVHDFPRRDSMRAAEIRSLALACEWQPGVRTLEIPPDACNVVCGMADTGPSDPVAFAWAAWRAGRLRQPDVQADLRGRVEREYILRKTVLAPIDPASWADLEPVLDQVLDNARSSGCGVIRALPMYLVWLADRARARGLSFPRLRALLPFGGLTSPTMRSRIEQGFGVPFRNVYGSGEFGSMAAGCGHGAALHVFDDIVHIDVVREGHPAPGGQLGRIVVTDLVNRAMPMFRYEIGDVGRWVDAACACGRAGRRLEVVGRGADVVLRPDGHVVPAADILDALLDNEDVVNGRLDEMSPGRWVATVATRSGAPTAPPLPALEALLGGALSKVRTTAFIRPEPSGKYRVAVPLPGSSSGTCL